MATTQGERVRLARKRRGWTQGDLASRAGCSQQTIGDIEKDKTPTSGRLPAIIEALGEDHRWIVSGIGAPAASGSPAGAVEAQVLPHYDVEAAGLRAIDPANVDAALDYLYSNPIPMSRGAFTVEVDANQAASLAELSAGDVLWVDPAAECGPGCLLMAVVPGSDFAQVFRYGSSFGDRFLSWDDPVKGASQRPCVLYKSYAEFADHDPLSEKTAALNVGRVVFYGRPL